MRPLTQKDYRHILAAFLMPAFGKRPIDAIARACVIGTSDLAEPLSSEALLRRRSDGFGSIGTIIPSRRIRCFLREIRRVAPLPCI